MPTPVSMENERPRSHSEPRTLVTHPELRSRQSFPFFSSPEPQPKGPLERFLSLFADVRAGEGQTALLLALNVFLLLAAYYVLRNVRQTLILIESGAVVASYAAAGQALALLVVVPLYGLLSTKVVRIRLITITTFFFISNLGIFWLLGQAGARVAVAFYVWIGVFNVFVVAQFWSFANDLYTEGQGRRLFPLIGVGASLGAVVGALVIYPLVGRLQLTPYALMLVSSVVLVVALGVTLLVNRREAAHPASHASHTDEQPLGRAGGFELIRKDRYLAFIFLLIVLLNVVNTTGGFVLNLLVETQSLDIAAIGERQQFVSLFFSGFDASIAIVGLLLQMFITSRAINHLGIRGSLFILPVLALFNYAVIAFAPILAVIRVGKILENATDYSIQNTLRHALFLPTSREAKYKAKAAVDTFGARLGDVLQAVLVFAGTAMGLTVAGFAWINVGLVCVWLFFAGQIAREHRKKTV